MWKITIKSRTNEHPVLKFSSDEQPYTEKNPKILIFFKNKKKKIIPLTKDDIVIMIDG